MFQRNISLSKYSSYKIGGPAKYFFKAKNIEDIIKAIKKWRGFASYRNKASCTGLFILGGGTNILFDDDGFNGLVIKPDIKFIKRDGNTLMVGAGTPLTPLLNYSIIKNLSGFEWAAGIPGTVGGAVRCNAGAFGGEMKDVIVEVYILDISKSKPRIKKRSRSACCFGYRSSIFKKQPFGKTGEIITYVVLKLKDGNRKSIKKIIKRNIDYRQKHHPLEYPSAGSIFENTDVKKLNKNLKKRFISVIKSDPFPVIPAAYLISKAGLRGISYGGAMISLKHPNFIVNVSNATAHDVKNLIKLVKKEVYKEFKIKLKEEIVVF